MKFKIDLHKYVLATAWWIQKKSERKFKNGLTFVIPLGELLEEHYTLAQFVEFGAIGLLGVALNYAVFFAGGKTDLSWILGILVAFVSNFWLDKHLVFEGRN